MKFWKQFVVDMLSIGYTVVSAWIGSLALLAAATAENWLVRPAAVIVAWIMFYPIYLFAKCHLTEWITRNERNSTKS